MSKKTKLPELFQALNECNDESGRELASFLRFIKFTNTESTRVQPGDYTAVRGYRIADHHLAAWLTCDAEMAARVLPGKDYRAFWKIIETAKATLTAKVQHNQATKKLSEMVRSLDIGKRVNEDGEEERPQVARETDVAF